MHLSALLLLLGSVLISSIARAGTSLPEGAAILPIGRGAEMLHQCSRSVPAAPSGWWQPAPDDVRRFEQALPAVVRASAAAAELDISRFPAAWGRQYVGIIRDGRRFVYGNFFPRDMFEAVARDWQREPVLVCDGGPGYFGAEFDAEAGTVTHLAFNGAI